MGKRQERGSRKSEVRKGRHITSWKRKSVKKEEKKFGEIRKEHHFKDHQRQACPRPGSKRGRQGIQTTKGLGPDRQLADIRPTESMQKRGRPVQLPATSDMSKGRQYHKKKRD